jgi:parallel beta-helix repeat protein
LNWNTYAMAGGTGGIYSGGLVLSNSSGWSVTNNQIEYGGSADPNAGCTPTGVVLSCAFGLQIINGSSGNDVTGNTVSNNFIGGIMTGSDTAKNNISSNTAMNNGLYDLYEDGQGHGNAFRHNTCITVGGSLSTRACQ